jgi:hypothetical protein
METLQNSFKYLGEAFAAFYHKFTESRWLYIIEILVMITWLLAMIFDF